MAWHKIDSVYLKNKGVIQDVKIEGKSFCLVFDEGSWHAFSRKCPHAGALLSTGWCENGKVVCSFHRHKFDLLSGRGDEGQNDYITIYPLKMEDDILYIDLPAGFFDRFFGKQ